MDGLAVDTLDSESPFAERTGFFEAEIPASYEDFEKYRKADAAASQALARHRDRLVAAEQSMKAGDWETARRHIEAALQEAPDRPPLLKKVALLYSLAGDYEVADKYFSRYLQLMPDDVDSLAAWAAGAIRMKDWKKAESLLQRACKQSPGHLAAHFQIVILQIGRGDDKPILPFNWRQLTLTDLYILANWMESDRPAYEKLLGEEGFESVMAEIFGSVHVSNLHKIRTVSQQVLAANRRSQWQSMLDLLVRLRDMGVQNVGWSLAFARASYFLGSAQEALDVLTQVQQQHPHLAEAWQNSAYVHIKAGDYEKGLADALEAQRLAPDDSAVGFTIICALAGAGKMDELWPRLETWTRKYPEQLKSAMDGDDFYLQVIRQDPRYRDVEKIAR